jgi:hypothetical protein
MWYRIVANYLSSQLIAMFLLAGDGERANTGAAEGWGGGAGPSGSATGSAIFGRVRTRSELEKLINSSIRPLYIKQEALDHEAAGDYGRMDTEGEQRYRPEEGMEDVQVVDVVLGEKKDPDSSEDSESDEEMEDVDDPDPVLDIRKLYGEEKDNKRSAEVEVVKPPFDNRYFAVKGLRNKSGVGRDWAEVGQGPVDRRASFITPDDDRLLYNSNSFRMEDMKNVSRSFDEKGRFVTC